MGVTLEGWDEWLNSLEATAQALDDERVIAAVAIEAAAPMVAAVKANVGEGSPWKETGHTRADIAARVDKESRVGMVKIAIGATKKHAFKLRFDEYGTSKQRAHPSLRMGHDSTIGAVAQAIGQGLLRGPLRLLVGK